MCSDSSCVFCVLSPLETPICCGPSLTSYDHIIGTPLLILADLSGVDGFLGLDDRGCPYCSLPDDLRSDPGASSSASITKTMQSYPECSLKACIKVSDVVVGPCHCVANTFIGLLKNINVEYPAARPALAAFVGSIPGFHNPDGDVLDALTTATGIKAMKLGLLSDNNYWSTLPVVRKTYFYTPTGGSRTEVRSRDALGESLRLLSAIAAVLYDSEATATAYSPHIERFHALYSALFGSKHWGRPAHILSHFPALAALHGPLYFLLEECPEHWHQKIGTLWTGPGGRSYRRVLSRICLRRALITAGLIKKK